MGEIHSGRHSAYPLDCVFHRCNIPRMEWVVEFTDEFQAWFGGLTEAAQDDIATKVEVLEKRGPMLGRPHVDTIRNSKHPNMKELIVQHEGDPYRVFFAFDP